MAHWGVTLFRRRTTRCSGSRRAPEPASSKLRNENRKGMHGNLIQEREGKRQHANRSTPLVFIAEETARLGLWQTSSRLGSNFRGR